MKELHRSHSVEEQKVRTERKNEAESRAAEAKEGGT
jgi:hypothetical protein